MWTNYRSHASAILFYDCVCIYMYVIVGNSMSNHPDGETKMSGICLTFTSQKGTDKINKMSKFRVLSVQAAM